MLATQSQSPLHSSIVARVKRQPLDVARVLAPRYPETPAISYIPALAWAGALRLGGITATIRCAPGCAAQVKPWIAGEKKLFGERVQLTSVAGTLIFAEIATADGWEPGERAAAAALADEGVAARRRRKGTRLFLSTARAGPTTCSWPRRCSRDRARGAGTNRISMPPRGSSSRMPDGCSSPAACSTTPWMVPPRGAAATASRRSG